MATLTELKTELATLEAQKKETKEYSIVGSHTVKNSDYEDLQKNIDVLKRRIYRYLGYTGRTFPDFT